MEPPRVTFARPLFNGLEHAPLTLPTPRKLRFDGAAIQVYKMIKDSAGVLGSIRQYTATLVKLQNPHLRTVLGPVLDEAEEAEVTSEISYLNIWALFPSNELTVITTGPIQGGKVKESWYHADNSYFGMTVHTVGYNGLYFGLTERYYEILEYCGRKEISGLPIFPLRFHRNSLVIRQLF